jgi:hypothetical protein
MQALSSATGLATERKPNLASVTSAVRSMIKELLEELLIIFSSRHGSHQEVQMTRYVTQPLDAKSGRQPPVAVIHRQCARACAAVRACVRCPCLLFCLSAAAFATASPSTTCTRGGAWRSKLCTCVSGALSADSVRAGASDALIIIINLPNQAIADALCCTAGCCSC